MADQITVEMIVEAIAKGFDQVEGALTGAGEAAESAGAKTGKAGFSFTELSSAINVAKQALGALKGVYDEVIAPTVEYAGQVRELTRTIGSSAEESSKLIQAADDVGISYGTLSSALEAAIRKGVDPSIEGIGKLSDEYLQIQDPIERTKFLMDNFGRSGADLAPLMLQGRDGIRAAGEAAEQTGLVMSQAGVDSARAYEIAMDDFGDAVTAVKMLLATGLIPGLTAAAKQGGEYVSAFRNLTLAFEDGRVGILDYLKLSAEVVWTDKTLAQVNDELTASLERQQAPQEAATARWQGLADQYAENAAAAEVYSNQLSSQTQWLAETAAAGPSTVEAYDAVAEANDRASAAASRLNMILAGAVGNELASYAASQADLAEQIAAARAEVEKLTEANGQAVTKVVDVDAAQQSLTIAMAGAETAAGTLADAQTKLSENTDPEKQLQLEAAVARAEQALGSAQGKVGEWNSVLAESGDTYVTDYSGAIDEATGKLSELEQAAADNAAAHELATEKILFGYLQQALAVDGLTLDEIKALTGVAAQWGLLDEATATAVDGILDAAEGLADGNSLAEFENDINGVRDSILGVPTDVNVTFHVNTVGQVPSYTPNGGNANAFAGGADFIVPPGYPNDSFPMFVQTGEHVVVTPAGQGGGSGGGAGSVTNVFNITAQYPMQGERSLRDDLDMYQMLAAPV